MKMPVISRLEMVKVLHRKGWTAIRQTGSHIIMQKMMSLMKYRSLSTGS